MAKLQWKHFFPFTGHVTYTKSKIGFETAEKFCCIRRNEGEGLQEAVANTTLEIMENP